MASRSPPPLPPRRRVPSPVARLQPVVPATSYQRLDDPRKLEEELDKRWRFWVNTFPSEEKRKTLRRKNERYEEDWKIFSGFDERAWMKTVKTVFRPRIYALVSKARREENANVFDRKDATRLRGFRPCFRT